MSGVVDVVAVHRVWSGAMLSWARQRYRGLSWEDIEDAYAEALACFWKEGYTVSLHRTGAFLCVHVRNRCVNALEAKFAQCRSADRTQSLDDVSWDLAEPSPGPCVELAEHVLEFAAQRSREDFLLVYFVLEALRGGEDGVQAAARGVAADMGVTVRTVLKRLGLLREAFRKHFGGVWRGPDGSPLGHGWTHGHSRRWRRPEGRGVGAAPAAGAPKLGAPGSGDRSEGLRRGH